MKYEIIKTENYLFVVDESEIKEGDWCTSHLNVIDEGKFHNSYTLFNPQNQEHLDMFKNCKKIIAHLPLNFSPILAGVDLLPPLEQEDNEKSLFANEIENMLEYDRGRWYGRIEGYNKAKEKYKYTEEDVIRIVEKSRATGLTAEYLMLTLSQPKIPIGFECVTSPMNIDEIREQGKGFLNANTNKIKTATTSEGHTQWVGTYIY